jgi:hypothetical protein
MLRVCHQARLTVEPPSRCLINLQSAPGRPSSNYTLTSLAEQAPSVVTLSPAKQRELQNKDTVRRKKLLREMHNNQQD